jgi:hypothetical protein
MISFFKSTLFLIKSIKNTVANSLFYSLFVLFFIIISVIFSIIVILEFNTSKNKIVQYKNVNPSNYNHNHNHIGSENNNIINQSNIKTSDSISINNDKKNYNNKSLISHAQCDELFLLNFVNHKNIFHKNNKKNNTTQKKETLIKSNNVKTIPKKVEKKVLIEKETLKKKKLIQEKKETIQEKKERVEENSKIKKIKNKKNFPIAFISNDKIAEKNDKKYKKEIDNTSISKMSVIESSVNSRYKINNSSLSFSSSPFLPKININKNMTFFENDTQSSLIENDLINNEEREDNTTFEEIDYEERVNQNELLEYIIRLKKNINQFPGKKVNLEIIILLEGSAIREIIFPKKLFSLAYKMYIINILKKIEIPKKLWNKKLCISV